LKAQMMQHGTTSLRSSLDVMLAHGL